MSHIQALPPQHQHHLLSSTNPTRLVLLGLALSVSTSVTELKGENNLHVLHPAPLVTTCF